MGPDTSCNWEANGGSRGRKSVLEGHNGGLNGCGEGYEGDNMNTETLKQSIERAREKTAVV